jgi:hypothetical protein
MTLRKLFVAFCGLLLLAACIENPLDSGGGDDDPQTTASSADEVTISPDLIVVTVERPGVQGGTLLQGNQMVTINGVATPVHFWEFIVTPDTVLYDQFPSCSRHVRESGSRQIGLGRYVAVIADLNNVEYVPGRAIPLAKEVLIRNPICLGLVTNNTAQVIVDEEN